MRRGFPSIRRPVLNQHQVAVLARYVHFERLRAGGLKFALALKEAGTDASTVRWYRQKIGMTTRGCGGPLVANVIPILTRMAA